MPAMTIEQARAYREQIHQNVQRHAGTTSHPKQMDRMRGLVAGTLDKWLGKDLRHALIDFLFENTEGGSTKQLNGAQLRAMLDWMALGHDDLNGYYSTSESLVANEAMRAIAMTVQPGLPGMPTEQIDAALEVVDAVF